jgi:NTE family protein
MAITRREFLARTGLSFIASPFASALAVSAIEDRRQQTSKLGLALSGGGFRAAFFHIGVLAQMADQGLLRHVEVISTVSGGSIIGALYYLHVKRLLEAKRDKEVTDQDYKTIISTIEIEFLRSVQKNIRTRIFSNPFKILRMCTSRYSKSDRLAELYDQYFYRPLQTLSDTGSKHMSEIKIKPRGEGDDFSPATDNERRKAKVPTLIINATTLNTGNNWRFSARTMGEAPRLAAAGWGGDALTLKRPLSYNDLGAAVPKSSLPFAVAASASVPGIFDPLPITDMYHDISVQLADGGLFDNLGVWPLIDEETIPIIISDASGHLEIDSNPAPGAIAVLLRSFDVLMARSRDAVLTALQLAYPTRVALIHLREGLTRTVVSPLGAAGKQPAEPDKQLSPAVHSSAFGVDARVQDRLSGVRTDLDSFTEVEAYSLMLDGYLISGHKLREINNLPLTESSKDVRHWRFLQIRPWMANPNETYLRQIEAANNRMFKVFHLNRALSATTVIIASVIVAGLWNLISPWVLSPFVLLRYFISGIILFVLVGFAPALIKDIGILRFLRPYSDFLARLVTRTFLGLLVCPFVWFHLWIFDPLFLRQGTLKRLQQSDSGWAKRSVSRSTWLSRTKTGRSPMPS